DAPPEPVPVPRLHRGRQPDASRLPLRRTERRQYVEQDLPACSPARLPPIGGGVVPECVRGAGQLYILRFRIPWFADPQLCLSPVPADGLDDDRDHGKDAVEPLRAPPALRKGGIPVGFVCRAPAELLPG